MRNADHQITGSMEVLPGEVWGLQDEIVTDKGRRAEQVVPLEKDRSGQVPPIITVRELLDLFPTLSDGVIRSRLKDRCNCVPFKVRSYA